MIAQHVKMSTNNPQFEHLTQSKSVTCDNLHCAIFAKKNLKKFFEKFTSCARYTRHQLCLMPLKIKPLNPTNPPPSTGAA